MTHAEFRATHPPAPGLSLEPTACPGELRAERSFHDSVDGHQVEILRCLDCGNTVAWDSTRDVVRNDYPDPREQARRLARAARLPGMIP
jgi:hypothetical protein